MLTRRESETRALIGQTQQIALCLCCVSFLHDANERKHKRKHELKHKEKEKFWFLGLCLVLRQPRFHREISALMLLLMLASLEKTRLTKIAPTGSGNKHLNGLFGRTSLGYLYHTTVVIKVIGVTPVPLFSLSGCHRQTTFKATFLLDDLKIKRILDHVELKEPMNPFWERIFRFLCAMM